MNLYCTLIISTSLTVKKIMTNHDTILSETDEINRSLGTIKLELVNKTTAISDALEEQKNRLRYSS